MLTLSMKRRFAAALTLSVGSAVAVSLSAGCSGSSLTPDAANVSDSDASVPKTNACGANLQNDNANCGACGAACASGEVCSQGKCDTSCGGGTALCGSSCADTKIDPDNCGSCGNKCGKGDVCSNGKCGTTCDATQTLCGGNTPYCADTMTDNANCGACGNVCGQGLACTDGKCPALTATGGSYTLFDSEGDGGVRSTGSAQGASFTLLNESDASVDLKWVDYSGVEQSYGTLAAGANLNQGTYVTHVWNVRNDADGGYLGGFVLNSPDAFTVTVH